MEEGEITTRDMTLSGNVNFDDDDEAWALLRTTPGINSNNKKLWANFWRAAKKETTLPALKKSFYYDKKQPTTSDKWAMKSVQKAWKPFDVFLGGVTANQGLFNLVKIFASGIDNQSPETFNQTMRHTAIAGMPLAVLAGVARGLENSDSAYFRLPRKIINSSVVGAAIANFAFDLFMFIYSTIQEQKNHTSQAYISDAIAENVLIATLLLGFLYSIKETLITARQKDWLEENLNPLFVRHFGKNFTHYFLHTAGFFLDIMAGATITHNFINALEITAGIAKLKSAENIRYAFTAIGGIALPFGRIFKPFPEKNKQENSLALQKMQNQWPKAAEIIEKTLRNSSVTIIEDFILRLMIYGGFFLELVMTDLLNNSQQENTLGENIMVDNKVFWAVFGSMILMCSLVENINWNDMTKAMESILNKIGAMPKDVPEKDSNPQAQRTGFGI